MKHTGLRVLLVLAALLAALLAWQWFDRQGQLRGMRWEPPPPVHPELGFAAPALPAIQPADAGQFLATLERPLFSPSRRPPPPPLPAVVQASPPPDPFAGLTLMGLYTAEDGVSGLLARVEGKVRRIAVNEALGGWTLTALRDRQAVFRRTNEERVIDLAVARPAPPTALPKAGQSPADPSAQAAAPPATPSGGAGMVGGSSVELQQKIQEEQRERLRRRNELRARAGAKLLTQ